MEFAIYVLKYFVTPTALIAAVAWLSKQIVLQALSTQSALAIEKFRHEMQHHLEKARYQFSRDIEEHKARFARLQEKRLDPILNLYSSVSELSSHATHIQTLLKYVPEDDISSEVEQLEKLGERAEQEYLKSLLFLPDPIANKAQALIWSIRNAELEYYSEITHHSKDPTKARSELQKSLTGDFARETADLAQQLRFLLGVENLETKV